MDKRVINYLENKVRLTENNYLIISALAGCDKAQEELRICLGE